MPAVTTSGWNTTMSSTQNGSQQQKKFNTISALSSKSNTTSTPAATTTTSSNGGNTAGLSTRASVKGLFDTGRAASSNAQEKSSSGDTQLANNANLLSASASQRKNLLGSGAAASVAREDGPWSVSVAEVPATEKRDLLRKKSKANGPQLYTLYVTTPTHNLTLTRSSVDLTELHSRLRDGQPSPNFPALPTLPQAPTGSSAPPLSRNKLLQTISRTLSPSGHKTRAGLSQLATAQADSTAPTKTNTASSTLAPPSTATTDASSAKGTPSTSSPNPTPSAPISPPNEETGVTKSSTQQHSTTTLLATYLTTIANMPHVKRHKVWKRFVRVGSDDLQSVRVERRVRKIRSDLAKHVKTAVAPANTNVAVTPSQSDIGEEGGRTDDDRSFSGRSTSHSFRNDRQEASGRSASTDGDRSAREDVRKNANFAGIPEESERQTSLEAVEGKEVSSSNAVASSSRPKTHKRDRRQRSRVDEKVTVDDFDMIRVLGKGCAGKVLLVRHKPTKGLFAMKSIHKRHVLAHQELQHTLTEQAVLKRMAREVMDPFVVKLWWSFHDVNNLYLVMDFHPGGDLATQLSRWGRLGRDRARFYAAEIVEGVEGLHRAGVIYRDLKPENVLIGVDGHIVLSDFGLSKEFPVRTLGDVGGGSSTPPPASHASKDGSGSGGKSGHWLSASEDARRSSSPSSSSDAFSSRSRNRWMDDRDVTTTFCGTAEYLAPEVIQGAAYSYEVDWWSFGTMLYEMLTGITPFWADTHADMYVRVLHDDLVFPEDRVLDQDTKSILRGLLQRNPMLRMKEPRIKKHPYFSMIEWDHVFHKRYIPPYIPPINPLDETDTQNFDETFLDMKPVVNGADDGEGDEEEGDGQDEDGAAKADGDAQGNTSKDAEASKKDIDALMATRGSDGKSLFDGYSFRGRRDSGSIRSSIFSSEPSEDQNLAALATARVRVDSDDDNAAARAAVAALDHLEREAAASEAALSSPSQTSTSTHPTSIKAGDEAARSGPETPTKQTRGGQGNVKQPATIAEAEREDEDDDWDMVDAPLASEPYMSEVNGGKGQNLFARGVVDTYRLLRRQESSRLPLGASYSGRTLNRLSRKQHASPRNTNGSNSAANASGAGNGSAVSLGSRSGNETGGGGTPQALGEDESSLSLGQTLQSTNSVSAGTTSSPLMPTDEANRQRKGGSPSLASSDEQGTHEKTAHKQRMKKMKRFTNFFETTR